VSQPNGAGREDCEPQPAADEAVVEVAAFSVNRAQAFQLADGFEGPRIRVARDDRGLGGPV